MGYGDIIIAAASITLMIITIERSHKDAVDGKILSLKEDKIKSLSYTNNYEHSDMDEDTSYEVRAFHKAVFNILKLYFDWHGGDSQYKKYQNNEEIIIRPELQKAFAQILNIDKSYTISNAGDELVPIFETSLTECYDSIRSIMKKHQDQCSDDKYRVLGKDVIKIIKKEDNELKVYW